MKELLDLILDIYQTPAEPAYWQIVLEKLSGYVKNGVAILSVRNNDTGYVDVKNQFGTYLHNISQESLDKYVKEVFHYDVWVKCEWKRDVGELCVFSDHIPLQELMEKPFYKEWLEPQGLSDGIAIQLHKREEFRIVLNVLYHDDSKDVDRLHQDLKLLTPHLHQAINLWMFKLDQDDSCYCFVNPRYLKDRYGLSPAEAEVATQSARFKTNQEVADFLYISINTVKQHYKNIKEKTGLGQRELKIIATGFIGFSRK